MTALDKFSIDLLVRTERYHRDAYDWDAHRAVWHPDSSQTRVQISWFTGDIDGWIKGCANAANAHAGGPFTHAFHEVHPLHIRVSGDRGLAISTNHVHMRRHSKENHSSDYDLNSWGHQLQTFLKGEDGEWRMRSFEQIYICDSITLTSPKPTDFGAEAAATDRESYKSLAYTLASLGQKVPPNIPGYDKEETWKPVLARNHKWLETGESWY